MHLPKALSLLPLRGLCLFLIIFAAHNTRSLVLPSAFTNRDEAIPVLLISLERSARDLRYYGAGSLVSLNGGSQRILLI